MAKKKPERKYKSEFKGEKRELAETIARACRLMGKLDLTYGAPGHVSYRLDGKDSMLIKGKGRDQSAVKFTTPAQIVEVDFDANTIAGGSEGLRSPSEAFLHIWMYKKNPELKCVIHMHPRAAILLSICDKEIVPIHGIPPQGARIAVQGVPTFPTSLHISDDAIGERFADFMGKSKVALMRGHGVATVGSGIEEATMRTLRLNELLKLTYDAYLIGGANPLPPEDLARLSETEDPNRPRGSAGGREGTLTEWRMWCEVTGELEE